MKNKKEIDEKVESYRNSLYGQYFPEQIGFACQGYRKALYEIAATLPPEEPKAEEERPNTTPFGAYLKSKKYHDNLLAEEEKEVKSAEEIGGYEETLKYALKNVIELQEQEVREDYNAGQEDAYKYALEMLDKHFKVKCDKCNGLGYTSEHDPFDSHEGGQCHSCPIQVQCEKCEATGYLQQFQSTPISNNASSGIEIIAQERRRHTEIEGWTEEHDSEHTDGSLAIAAACYAAPGEIEFSMSRLDRTDRNGGNWQSEPRRGKITWPWDYGWDKRHKHDRIRQLAIGGSLLAAEIDRLLKLKQ